MPNLLKDPRTNWKYIWIVVIAGFLAGAGILGYYYLWIADLESRIAEIEVKIPVKVVADETANWKTYRNEEYGFEVKYAEDWIVNDESPNVEIASVDANQYLHGVGVPPKGNAWIIFLPSLPDNFSEGEEEVNVGPGSDFIIILDREI